MLSLTKIISSSCNARTREPRYSGVIAPDVASSSAAAGVDGPGSIQRQMIEHDMVAGNAFVDENHIVVLQRAYPRAEIFRRDRPRCGFQFCRRWCGWTREYPATDD